jgi:hypothetical protein
MTQRMTKRNLMMPNDLWRAVQRSAVDLSAKEEHPVSTAEAIRRLLEEALRQRGKL